MEIKDLYNKLDSIFIEHTTHNWKNGWQHEGDRLSKELTIQKEIKNHNLFLLTTEFNNLILRGPASFQLEVQIDRHKEQVRVRIDIHSPEHIYYYIDNDQDWLAQMCFIVDICQELYESNCKLKDKMDSIPKGVYGNTNPQFAKNWHRDNQLEILLSS